jgi:hypothetical protein
VFSQADCLACCCSACNFQTAAQQTGCTHPLPGSPERRPASCIPALLLSDPSARWVQGATSTLLILTTAPEWVCQTFLVLAISLPSNHDSHASGYSPFQQTARYQSVPCIDRIWDQRKDHAGQRRGPRTPTNRPAPPLPTKTTEGGYERHNATPRTCITGSHTWPRWLAAPRVSSDPPTPAERGRASGKRGTQSRQ